MMFKKMKYIYLSVLSLVAAGMMGACSDAEFPIDNDEEVFGGGAYEGDMLMVNITLDNMGGATTRVGEEDELKKWENYVDPEKIRVLIFDEDDKFLFESKSRWIRQLDPAVDHSVWSVSIPMYSNANDKEEYDWDWDAIRTKLTTENFKIAILANRPDREWNMGILKKMDDGQTDVDPDNYQGEGSPYVVPNGWFGSTGPYWTVKNSVVYKGDGKVEKDVFDLHHCQYDPIYHGKNYYTTVNARYYEVSTGQEYNFANTNYNFYSCITEDSSNGDNPFMGATSSWVDWGESDNIEDKNGWKFRMAALPGKERPIPMYGIQQYAALTGWKKGTTINLTREGDKAISLLRSVVKLVLAVPTGTVEDVTLFYSNIYARCEPLDVWTPTNEIWKEQATDNTYDNVDCEWTYIKEFSTEVSYNERGRMTTSSDPYQSSVPDVYDRNDGRVKTANIVTENDIRNSKALYQKRLSRFYGIWRKEKNWSFDKGGAIDGMIDRLDVNQNKFMRIFNPCIQRNNMLYVKKTYTANGYDYYVVYTGERNINDPSNLGQMGNQGGGNPTVIYWCMTKFDGTTTVNGKKKGTTYSMPIINYSASGVNTNWTNIVKTGDFTEYDTRGFTGLYGPANSAGDNAGTKMGDYLRKVQDGSISSDYWPLPLLRNHVYTITLGSPSTRSDGEMNFSSIQFEEKYTKDIGFSSNNKISETGVAK